MTESGRPVKEIYEFGPFRVDPARETLLRAGEPVPLTPKTFQILLVLLRNSREVVTKDDLMKNVWPDTFVEEANLSRNIFMLRKALGETAHDHRYIVTVPGRGYRLAESVNLIPEQDFSLVAASHSVVQVRVKETKPWWGVVAAAVVLSMVSVGWWWISHRRSYLSERDTVVLADFVNSTGDPVFDGTLRQGMAVQLEQSPFLSLVSEERIQHTVHLMGQPGNMPLIGPVAREVCERTGSAVVLDGSISSLGDRYVLGLRATNCRSGEVLDEEQEQVAKKENVLDSLGQMAARFRTRIGESRASLREHDTPLVEATTPSLDAWKAYSSGWQVLFSTGSAAALPLFQRATEIDPKFAMGYAMIGRLYGDMGESVLSAENTRKAYELRDRANDSERFFISASNDLLVTGNLEKAQQTCELWAQAYPRDARPHGLLASVLWSLGNYPGVVDESAKSILLDPDFTPGYVNLSYGYLFLNRLPEAAQPIQRAAERKLDMPELLILRYQIAFLKADTKEMARVATMGQERVGADDWLTGQQAYTAGYSGHLQQASVLSRRAASLAQQEGQRERAAQHLAGAAAREALAGNAKESRQNVAAALSLSTGRDVQYGAAFALAVVGDSARSQMLANDLEKRYPEDSLVRFSYLPTLRALLALNRREPAKAIDELQVALPYEMGWPGSSSVGFIGVLYPVYVRGEAYLAEGRGSEAAAEFQKVLDHRGLVVNDLVGALAHLELARAWVLSGDPARGKLAYQDFFALWNGADPDVPSLKQARAEYSQLN